MGAEKIEVAEGIEARAEIKLSGESQPLSGNCTKDWCIRRVTEPGSSATPPPRRKPPPPPPPPPAKTTQRFKFRYSLGSFLYCPCSQRSWPHPAGNRLRRATAAQPLQLPPGRCRDCPCPIRCSPTCMASRMINGVRPTKYFVSLHRHRGEPEKNGLLENASATSFFSSALPFTAPFVIVGLEQEHPGTFFDEFDNDRWKLPPFHPPFPIPTGKEL